MINNRKKPWKPETSNFPFENVHDAFQKLSGFGLNGVPNRKPSESFKEVREVQNEPREKV